MRRFFIILGLLLPVIGASCDRYVPVSSPAEDPPVALPVPQLNDINASNGSLEMSWEVDSEANVSFYRIYHAVTATGTFLADDSTSGMSIRVTGLDMRETHRFAVAPVSTKGVEGNWSRIVTLVPAQPATRLPETGILE